MQGIGTLNNNEYTILSVKHNEGDMISYLARHNQTQNLRIIVFKNDHRGLMMGNDDFPANEINVLNILNNANNPNILGYIENGNGILALNGKEPKNKQYLIFENASKFDLFTYIKKGGKFPERQAKLIFRKILNGVSAIHNANYCHLFLTPSNILFHEQNNHYEPKIHGLNSCRLNANNLQNYSGIIHYRAPEIEERRPFNGFKCDIFYLGQILFNLVCGIHGFSSAKKNDLYYRLIMQKNFYEYWNSSELKGLNVSQGFRELVVRMLAYKPDERPTINDILQNEWMREIDNQIGEVEQELSNELHQREANI